ncbi:carbonic anhydrase 1-like [Penaeus monodon]|uniref:carbonic anhydrase 1-like n=1 Tax=Penaeus monodon TaxID=6687 RepID=UPI0018A78441|nr:carbonic anhydrase 1-like [Penaeus monodon]
MRDLYTTMDSILKALDCTNFFLFFRRSCYQHREHMKVLEQILNICRVVLRSTMMKYLTVKISCQVNSVEPRPPNQTKCCRSCLLGFFPSRVLAVDADHVDETPHWGYEGTTGPTYWPSLFPEFCSGRSQSPIDLNDDDDTLETSTDDWVLDRYDIIPKKMIIKNNGHTAQIEWTTTDIREVPNVSGGNLGDTYAFAQFHFHWGKKNNRGSEHTFNGKKFPAELHLVHFNTKYDTIGDAVLKADGLAVLGVMLEIANEDNEDLSPIIDGLSTIVDANSQKTLATPFPLSDLLPADTSSFYRYSGSLTTPNCNEVVTWTVFENSITISKAQIEKFRELLDEEGHHVEDNFRHVQPLNGRLLEKIQLV